MEQNIIHQLIEENNRLTKLLKENHVDFEKSKIDYSAVANDLFHKARSISKLAYWHYSLIDKKLEISVEAYKILEIQPWEEYHKEIILDRIHPENREKLTTELKQKISTENFFEINTRLLVPDKSIKYINVKVIVEREQNGNIISISGTLTDNTENQFLIDELKDNEKLFRSLFNNLTDIFIIFEIEKDSNDIITDYIYRDVNPSFEIKMGIKKAEIIGKKLSSRPDFYQQLNPLFRLSAIARQPQQDRLFVQHLDGFFDILIYTPSENNIATIWRDVTLMVEAESSLRESEEKYRQIFSIGSDALFMFDHNSGRILDVNPTGCKLFGYSRDSLLKMHFKQLSATPDKLYEQIKIQKSLLHDFIALKSNKTEFPVEISLAYFNWSGRKVSVASIRDTSERVIAQEKLIKSEQKFKQLFDFSNDAILLIKNYRIIDFNQKSISLFQHSPEELLNKTLWNLSPTKQVDGDDSRNKAIEYIQNSLLGNQLQVEWIFQLPSRNTFYADIKLSPITVGNEKVVQAIVRDISPMKESQKAQILKEERWKTSLQISSIGVWDWNIITNEVYFSTVWKNLIGYEKEEIANNVEEFFNRVHADDLDTLRKALDDFFVSRSINFSQEFRMRCKNGTYKWIHAQGIIYSYSPEGKTERFIGTHTDITRKKMNEEKFETTIHNLNFSTSVSQVGYWELDLRNMLISGTRNTFSLLGFSDTDQLSLRQLGKIMHPEDQNSFISQFINQSESPSLENIFRISVNNTTQYIISRSRPVLNSKNILTGYRGTFQNITSLRQDVATINNENAFMRNIALNMPYPVMVMVNDTTSFANSKASELTGFSNNEITEKNISPLTFTVPEDHNMVKKLADTVMANPSQQAKIQARIETKNGRVKWVEMAATAVVLKEGKALIYIIIDISAQKTAEISLQNSEKQFKSIVTNSNSGLALVKPDGHFIYTNETFHTLTGTTHTELKGKTIESLFSYDDFNTIAKGMESLTLSVSNQFTPEFKQIGTNKIWVKLNIVPMKTTGEDIDYFIFYCYNIDVEKNLLTKLETTTKTFSVFKECTPFGFAVFNNRQELLNYNSKFSDDIRIPKKQKISITDIEQLAENLPKNQPLGELGSTPLSFEVLCSKQQFLQVEIVSTYIEEEKFFYVYTLDITPVKLKIGALSHQLERLQGVFDYAPLGIILIDKNRNIIISNQQFEKTFEYNSDELRFVKLDSIIDTQNLGECITNFAQLFTGVSQSFQSTLLMNTKGSETKWISATASSIKDNFGDSRYAVFITEDISKRKADEQEMLSKERIQTLRFVADGFAHQFNNILMSIYGNAYILNNSITDDNLSRYTANLLSSTNRASDLTHRLLSFSENGSNLDILLNSNELLNNIVPTSLLGDNIKLQININNKNEKLLADPFKLRRALQYIIENAVESMPNGGNLNIDANIVYFENEGGEQDVIPGKGKYLRITIADDGAGIGLENVEKVFDPFYTTKPTTHNEGLGLSIAKQIINAHNGAIKIYSEKEKGTRVNIYLPIKEAVQSINSVQPDEQRIAKGSAKILLVDDEEVVRIITAELLNELGYDVYSFASSKKAIQFYKDNFNTINLVILDKQMPEMDGFEVFQQLRAVNHSVKAIILTGVNIDAETRKSFSSSLSGYIQKPVSIEKLSTTISTILFDQN